MKVNREKSIIAEKIFKNVRHLNGMDQVEILSQLLIKIFLTRVGSDKDFFIEMIAAIFDELEEYANVMGYIAQEEDEE